MSRSNAAKTAKVLPIPAANRRTTDTERRQKINEQAKAFHRKGDKQANPKQPEPRVVHAIPIERLKTAHYNPKSRSDAKSNQDIRKLADSIAFTGVYSPLWVTPKHTIIEGHRRHTALGLLGYETIDCFVYDGDPNRLYACINANQKPLNSNDKLSIYLIEPSALTAKTQSNFEVLERIVGRDTMEFVYKNGGSYSTLLQARRVAVYCVRGDDQQFIAKTARWLMSRRMTLAARMHMQLRQEPITLYNAVIGDKDLATAGKKPRQRAANRSCA